MTNFNHGHAAFFWDLLIQALEDDGLENERKRILLISPWIVDLPIRTSNMDSSVFSMLLGGRKKRGLQNLSDVLEAMQDIGFKIDVVTLDSATKGLPKNDRRWLQREEEFVKKLMSKGIAVWKKMGLHAKMYLFPHGALTGSVNLTRQGFFANAENITHCIVDDREEYESVVINADAQLRGSIHYFDRGGPRPERLVLPPEHATEPTGDYDLDAVQNSGESDEYVHPPLIPLGQISNTGSHFIEDVERRALNDHIQAFEEELREVILQMYKQQAHEMTVWSDRRKNGEIPSKPRAMWTKLLVVNAEQDTLHERARKQMFEYKTPPYEPEDFPEGRLPDPNNLSHETVLTYGTTLGDLRSCILGNTNNFFHDFEGTNLQDKTLNKFTGSMLGVRRIEDERVRYFWLRLFGPEEAFAQVYFARNELFHSKPLARYRAIKCQQALIDFEKKLLTKFNEFMSR